MKHSILSLLTAVALLAGCATPVSDATLDRIEQVSQIAASVGVAADVLANKEHRPYIIAVQEQLKAQIATGTVTSAQLSAIIVNKLPLDPKTALYFQGGLVLWGIFPEQWLAPNIKETSRRAAIGLVAGIELGLKAGPEKASAKSVAAVPPKPTTSNVRKF